MLWDAGRERLDLDLARDLLHAAALLRPRRVADELHGDRRLDRPIEPHLVEVDVRDGAADRVALEVLKDGVVRRRLPLDHDVDDRVEAGRPREGRAKLALADDDRAGRALAVQDARHQPLLPEAADAA